MTHILFYGKVNLASSIASYNPMKHSVIVILGPTASGKSDLALYLAEHTNGVIINCDSMQIYAPVHAITARPPVDHCQRVPHYLYGYLDVGEPSDVLAWRLRAYQTIDHAIGQGKTPCVVGGTGFYVRALIEGLSAIPDVPDSVRQQVRTTAETMTTTAIRAYVQTFDAPLARRFSDRQRLLRAWEVYLASGRPLSHWQSLPPTGVPPHLNFVVIALLPPRDWLYDRCNGRFDTMIDEGALDEVTYLHHRLQQRTLSSYSPILKACGVPELMGAITGTTDLDTAITSAKTATRRYAKRQITWLRGQIQPHLTITHALEPRFYEQIVQKIQKFC